MVNLSEARKKVKRRKSVSGKHSFKAERERPKKILCALCSKQLSGILHGQKKSEVEKHSRTAKRPTGLFGGALCVKCRQNVMVEAIKVKSGIKALQKVKFSIKPYVEIAMNFVE